MPTPHIAQLRHRIATLEATIAQHLRRGERVPPWLWHDHHAAESSLIGALEALDPPRHGWGMPWAMWLVLALFILAGYLLLTY